MKKKIVLKVQMNCQKCRTKVLKIVAKVEGVESVALQGEEKEQIVVIGDGVDPIKLATSLRKVGRADIMSVEEVKATTTTTDTEYSSKPTPYYYGYPHQYPTYELMIHDPTPGNCSIM